MVTVKLAVAIITFIISGGHVVLHTFRHHESVNPQHGLLKFIMVVISVLSLVYLIKDMSDDFATTAAMNESTAEFTANAEIVYWHDIDRNPSPENYCAYIEKYPQGQFVEIARHRLPADCAQLARQAAEEARVKQQAQAQAALEAKLTAKVESEAQALREAKRKLEAETQAAAELKAKMEAEAQAFAAEKAHFERLVKTQTAPIPVVPKVPVKMKSPPVQKVKKAQVKAKPMPPLPTLDNPSPEPPTKSNSPPIEQPPPVVTEELPPESVEEQ